MSQGRFIAIASVSLISAMFVVFCIALWIGEEPLHEVEATIVANRTEHTYETAPVWILAIEYSYQIDGQNYVGENSRVRSADERGEAVKNEAQWPVGRRLTVYVSRDDPRRSSIYPDGGLQGRAVAWSLGAGIATAFAFALGAIVMRYRSESKKTG